MKKRRAVVVATLLAGIAGLAVVSTAVASVGSPGISSSAKSAFLEQLATIRATAPRPAHVAPPVSISNVSSLWPQGIQDSRQSPDPETFNQINDWSGTVRGQQVAIHAGSVAGVDRGPSATGELLYTVTAASGQETMVPYYNASVAGPFRITGALGMQVSVAGAGGRTFAFDVATHSVSG